jgi:MFS transporter, DHA1 family, tetracycline resistance protein
MAGFIFITIFIDVVGLGLLIPIFPDIIRRFSTDPQLVSYYFGFFISIYSLIQFFASPILGALSDKFGRRPVLLVSLCGAALDYMLMAYAPNLWILFLGRIISGLTGASMTVASAYMADISNDKNRSANFGLIGAAFGFGFVIGPALGGVLGSYNWLYPFYAAAGMNFLNFLWGLFVLPESLPKHLRRNIQIRKLNPISSIVKIFSSSPVIIYIWIYFLLYLAGQVHPSSWTLYTEHKFGWTAYDVGLSLAFVGVSVAFGQGVLTRIVIPRIGDWNALAIGVLLNALDYFLFGIATRGWMMYLIVGFGCLAGVAGPAIQSLISRNTPTEEQGELQGSLMGVASLTSILGPLLYTNLFAFFTRPDSSTQIPGISYYVAALFCAIAVMMLKLQPIQLEKGQMLTPSTQQE